ncbi:MAG: glycosyltransferase, partial [Methanosphaera sp.]|nr:glycosyltransferase [Methanosphaera sp.]
MSPENLKTRSEYGRNYQSDYNLLKKSEYFDEKYYRQQFSSDEDIGDPIAHFLLSDRYMATCKNFNPKWYNDNYRDVSSTDINPLVHFLRYGQDEHRLYRYARLSHESFKNMDNCATIEEYYNTIYDSDVFDIEYYLSNNDVDLEGLDPIIHYILIGANKGYNPSKTFSTYDFVDSDNLDKVTTNPLYHFIKYGYSKKVEPFTDKFHYVNNFETFYTKGILEDIQLHLEQKISIIIPIYNAYEETKACITSVLRNTHINYELILINDCSTDERISQLLSQVDRIPFVKVVENEHNQGFVKNVNLGMNLAENDVVLLNSDTIVTPKWLSKLIISAYSDSTIATVTPFCNSSDISIPELGTISDQLFLNKNAYQVDKLFNNEYLESPTGNGFCLYIKRGAIRKLGVFDEVFGMGYGEETDFTCRAKEAGWKNIRNNDVFVYHRRHASFSDEKSSEYKKKNKSIIQQRHGYVYDAWDDFVASSKVKEAIDTIRDNLVEYKNSEKILYVTEMDNDVPVVDDRFYDIASKYDTYVLTINRANIRLFIYDGIDTFLKIRQLPVVDIDDNNYFESFYYKMLLILKIDLLYVRNFYNFFTPKRPNLSVFVNFTHYMEIPMIYDGAIYQDRNIMDVIEEKLNPLDSLDECISDNESYFDFTNKKIAVYTAISGDYDEIVTPTHIEEDFDYICFTDNPNLVSDFWDIRPMEELDLDEIRKARRYKVLPHKYLDEYDYSIWIDGNFDITGSLKDYIHEYSRNHKLLAIKHEDRDCIYDEMEACLELEKDTRETMESQINKYKSEGYPEHNGLVASGILFRDHHDRDVIKVMEDWYQEIVNHSYRDQLSFNYVCWKNNFSYDESLIFYPKNEYFKRLGHSNFRVFLKTSNSAIEVIKDKLLEPTSIIIPIY